MSKLKPRKKLITHSKLCDLIIDSDLQFVDEVCYGEDEVPSEELLKEFIRADSDVRYINSQAYITNYLDPQLNWYNFVSTEKQMLKLQSVEVNWDIIADYINHQLTYTEFLHTAYWNGISNSIKANSNFKCELCGSKYKLNVHHKTYKHHGYELQHMEDLICVCEDCHKNLHNIK